MSELDLKRLIADLGEYSAHLTEETRPESFPVKAETALYYEAVISDAFLGESVEPLSDEEKQMTIVYERELDESAAQAALAESLA
jgi:hypothetical protein